MAIATKTLDRQLHKVLAAQSGTRIFAHAAFLAGHRYEIRHPKQVAGLLHKVNQNGYFAHYIRQSLPHWFTVVNRVTVFQRQFLLVKMNALDHRYWLVPFLAIPRYAQIRGWLAWREQTLVTSSRSIRVRLYSPVGTPRLITEALGRAYPTFHVERIFRAPGLATFVTVTTTSGTDRRRCYSPVSRQYLRRLFYSDATPTLEVFRLVLADQPLAKQAAALLGVPREQVRYNANSATCHAQASGRQVRALAPLVAQFLHCKIRVH